MRSIPHCAAEGHGSLWTHSERSSPPHDGGPFGKPEFRWRFSAVRLAASADPLLGEALPQSILHLPRIDEADPCIAPVRRAPGWLARV
jgi:hypothetical protein